jgi:hypothetical protein
MEINQHEGGGRRFNNKNSTNMGNSSAFMNNRNSLTGNKSRGDRSTTADNQMS